MPSPEMLLLLDAVLNEVEADNLSDDTIEKLSYFFTEELLLAALDLIDRECVIKYITPWGRTHFQVQGSTEVYTVFPSLSNSPTVPSFCSCPAFSFAVLISDSHLMCKHVLATRLADRLGKCIERHATQDDLVSILSRQYSNL